MEKRASMGGEQEWLDAVDSHMWGGDEEGGLALLARVEQLYPESKGILNRAIIMLADSNRPGQVLEIYQDARWRAGAVDDQLSADALACLGVANRDLRLPAKARVFFRLSLAKEPANKRASMGLAQLLLDEGRLQAALGALHEYTVVNADDAWGWLALANARNQNSQSGRSEYRKVIELTMPDADGDVPRSLRAARATAFRQLGREKEALAIMSNAVQNEITDPDIACDYAQMLMETGRYDECDAILRATVKKFPSHVWAYRLEATSLVRRKKYDLAVARLQEALK